MAELQDSLDERKRKADESSLHRMLYSQGSGSRSVTGQGSVAPGAPRRRAGRIFDTEGADRWNLEGAMDAEADLVSKTVTLHGWPWQHT